MGRPKKSEPRAKQLNLCLTERELETIQRRAEAVGMRPVHFGRAMLLDETRAPAVGDGLARLIYDQLVRLGRDLNTLLRRFSAAEVAPPLDLEPLLIDIRELIARARQ